MTASCSSQSSCCRATMRLCWPMAAQGQGRRLPWALQVMTGFAAGDSRYQAGGRARLWLD